MAQAHYNGFLIFTTPQKHLVDHIRNKTWHTKYTGDVSLLYGKIGTWPDHPDMIIGDSKLATQQVHDNTQSVLDIFQDANTHEFGVTWNGPPKQSGAFLCNVIGEVEHSESIEDDEKNRIVYVGETFLGGEKSRKMVLIKVSEDTKLFWCGHATHPGVSNCELLAYNDEERNLVLVGLFATKNLSRGEILIQEWGDEYYSTTSHVSK